MAMGGKIGQQFTEINVTPLTDVFLVLLVIMILVAPLVNISVLKIRPPAVISGAPTEPEPNTLNFEVANDGTVTLNHTLIAPPDTTHLEQAIQSQQQRLGKSDIPLTIQSDADALQKYVVAIMDAAAGAGIKSVRMLPLRK